MTVNETLLLDTAMVESSTGHIYQLAYESPGPALENLQLYGFKPIGTQTLNCANNS